jgi:hypothetical protein
MTPSRETERDWHKISTGRGRFGKEELSSQEILTPTAYDGTQDVKCRGMLVSEKM